MAAGLAAVIALVWGTQIRKEVSMNILIVEDETVIANLIGMPLEETGHFSIVAHIIEAYLAELRHNRVDAVLR